VDEWPFLPFYAYLLPIFLWVIVFLLPPPSSPTFFHSIPIAQISSAVHSLVSVHPIQPSFGGNSPALSPPNFPLVGINKKKRKGEGREEGNE
jgi:hypothetical protein